ncbi:DUF4179 domain-containing protein [Paenibacillus sp. S150]|uniref:DUF4179 domain-containing protein n=1 Tax=Paenibacillus sp. S150 TaxID=2749826 RepID=UPI001C59C372|nr:DUF4179 domain-containing protein [Paenibacillus sp. S150]MBW4080905.1 DUF4179 domain-containing protein [Paenibacillus sp. S150]
MTGSSEEQALLNDAVRLQEELDRDAVSTALRTAVQSGMERGERRIRKRFFSKSMGLGITAAAITAAVLFILPYLLPVPQPAGQPESADWGELEAFRDNAVFGMDVPTLDSAIRSGYIQLVNKTAESEGYAITLNAIAADENRIMFLYTATTDDKQEIYSINSAKLKNTATGSYLSTTGQAGGNVKIPEPEKHHIFYGRGVVEMDRTEAFPQQLEAEFRIASVDPGKMADPKTGTIMADMHYSPVLKIVFTLDPKFKEAQTTIVKPDLPFTLNGHDVVLSQVEISPLLIRARVALKNPEDNDWEIRNEIFGNTSFEGILSEVDGKPLQLSPVSGSGTEDGFEYAFASNWLDHPESLVLKIRDGMGSKQQEYNLEMYSE